MSLRPTWRALLGGVLPVLALGVAGCEIEPNSVIRPRARHAHAPPLPKVLLTIAPPAAPPPDPFGPKPALAAPKVFEPPAPEVIKAANGMTVWLLERRALPLVAATIVIPTGSAADPKDRAGLAHITADMLDEGAGKRSAVEVSTAINDLGATLSIGVQADGSVVSLSVLRKNFKPAFEIMSDVVARPRLDPKEWKRVSDLWKNDLAKRAEDPVAVSRVVSSAVLYGPGTPYGHPADGLLADAKKIDLGAVKAFYGANFRPDKAVLVIAGAIGKDEVMEAINSSLGTWKASKPKASEQAAPAITVRAAVPRLVLVDREDAPQSVIAVVREGVAASDPKAPLLDLINTALGGSFTSRLNQNLREDHGWTYGARSAFVEARAVAPFVARAAVVTEATGSALKEMLGELDKMAASGLSDDEVVKVKAQDRADMVQGYETLGSVSRRFGSLALLGLAPDFDAVASRARQQATKAQLAGLAGAVSSSGATIIVVGPKAKVSPQLAAIGMPEPELWGPEGVPATGADSSAAKPPAGTTKQPAPPQPKK